MPLKLLRHEDYKIVPWANGLGTTREIARADRDGKMLWRVSMADVVADGPFSSLPGIDRTIMLASGAGFTLDFGLHGRVPLTDPLRPVHFSGDWTTAAVDVAGTSVDLNIMTARGEAAATTIVHTSDAQGRAGDAGLFIALEGAWTIAAGDASLVVAPWDCAMTDTSDDIVTIVGSGRLVQVRVNRNT